MNVCHSCMEKGSLSKSCYCMNYNLLINDLRYFSLKDGHKGGVVVHTVQCTTRIMFQT